MLRQFGHAPRLMRCRMAASGGLDSSFPCWPPHRIHPLATSSRRGWEASGNGVLERVQSARSSAFCARAVGASEVAPADADTYLSVNIRCRKEDVDALSDALLSFGACSASTGDIGDAKSDDEVSVNSVFTNGTDVGLCISNSAGSIGLNYQPAYNISVEKHRDWVAFVEEQFQPVNAIDGVWVIPYWRAPPDPEAINIVVNPGLVFGTGDHPTTRLCLLMVQKFIQEGSLFFDYGTGSGVLSILALKIGAARSVAIDIDPQALRAARENASLNGFASDRMSVFLVQGDASAWNMYGQFEEMPEELHIGKTELESSRGKCDVVIANILLNPLVELVQDIVGYAKPGATVGVSGITSAQVSRATKVYSKYLENISIDEMGGWACLHGRKRATVVEA